MKNLQLSNAEAVITDRSSRSLMSYFEDVRSISMIDDEEMQRLNDMISRGGNEESRARQRLVEGNLRFVISIAKRFHGKTICLEDLIQEGNIGLVKASRKYDATKGLCFTTLAIAWIQGSIICALQNYDGHISLPKDMHNAVEAYKQFAQKFQQTCGYEPSVEMYADMTGFDSFSLRQALTSKQFATSSAYDGNAELLSYECDTEDALDTCALNEELRLMLASVLSARETEILYDSFGLSRPALSVNEMTGKYSLSRSRIFNIRESALKKIRHCTKARRVKKILRQLIAMK